MRPEVGVVRLEHGRDLPLPAYETSGAAGMDLRAAIAEDQPLVLRPGARLAVATGLAIALAAWPRGAGASPIRPRATPRRDAVELPRHRRRRLPR